MSGRPLLFGGIADDLTGALELAGMLRAGGCNAVVATGPTAPADLPDDVDALVLAIQSRVLPAAEAEGRFAAAMDVLTARRARQIFFKYCATFDSTPDGNIGNCADLLIERTGAKSLLFCPAFPAVNRTVYQGHLFVGDRLVSESPKRHDPLTPMSEPDLVRVLGFQTGRGVGLVTLRHIRGGSGGLRQLVMEKAAAGAPFLITDCVEEDDLRVIAGASWDAPAMTGGSSVAAHYPAIWREHGLIGDHTPPALPARSGKGAVLAGSLADRTAEQVRYFGEHRPVHHIDVLADEQPVARALDWAAQHLGDGSVCITTGTDRARTQEIQRRLGVHEAARRAEAVLGDIGTGLVARGVDRLVVAGGETSGAVVRNLGIGSLTVAPYTTPGIGLCAAAAPVPIGLCLKSGKLGEPDLFLTALAAMERPQ